LPSLQEEGATLAALSLDLAYRLVPETGLRQVVDPADTGLPGKFWLALAEQLASTSPLTDCLSLCAQGGVLLRQQLLQLLHYHSGVRVFRTRQLMRDVQSLMLRH
jgi:DNA repair protein RecO (recombination protein O)